MPRYADYHRTVVGYHGTRRSTALRIVQGLRGFEPSENDDDWLGHGVYFWEYAPQQAWLWAEQRRRSKGWDEDVAVGAMINQAEFKKDRSSAEGARDAVRKLQRMTIEEKMIYVQAGLGRQAEYDAAIVRMKAEEQGTAPPPAASIPN